MLSFALLSAGALGCSLSEGYEFPNDKDQFDAAQFVVSGYVEGDSFALDGMSRESAALGRAGDGGRETIKLRVNKWHKGRGPRDILVSGFEHEDFAGQCVVVAPRAGQGVTVFGCKSGGSSIMLNDIAVMAGMSMGTRIFQKGSSPSLRPDAPLQSYARCKTWKQPQCTDPGRCCKPGYTCKNAGGGVMECTRSDPFGIAPTIAPTTTNCPKASDYRKLGMGYCNAGYYAGWEKEDATLKACMARCASEDKCVAFSLKKGETCSRYDKKAGECSDRKNGLTDHVSYLKKSATRGWACRKKGGKLKVTKQEKWTSCKACPAHWHTSCEKEHGESFKYDTWGGCGFLGCRLKCVQKKPKCIGRRLVRGRIGAMQTAEGDEMEI